MASSECPINGRLVDSNACRLCALFALIILAAAVASGAHWLVGLLAIEFALRLRLGLGRTPLGRLALKTTRVLGLKPHMVDSAPKRFAGGLALALSVSALAASVLGSQAWFFGIVSVFGVCAALEAFAGVCLGCHVYSWLPAGLARRHAHSGYAVRDTTGA